MQCLHNLSIAPSVPAALVVSTQTARKQLPSIPTIPDLPRTGRTGEAIAR